MTLPPTPGEPDSKKVPGENRAHLQIVPLGKVDGMVLSIVAANIQALMGMNTDVAPCRPLPDHAYQLNRRQYDAYKIIQELSSASTGAMLRLGITTSDICTPVLTFVYGESQIGGTTALISLYRIVDEASQTTYARAVKIGLHEVGHLLGIEHCRSRGCLMRFVTRLDRLDQLEIGFCEACEIEMSRRLRHLFGRRA